VSGVWYWPKRSPSGGRLAINMTYGDEAVIRGQELLHDPL
jgi:hypothetical protein